jgi:hypothetical protein
MNFSLMIKNPSAFVPLIMSFLAITIVVIHINIYGVVRDTDEGTAAHLFQLIIAAQAPIIAYFAFKWIPQNPKNGFKILFLQIIGVTLALSPIYFLKL